ncbi:PAS domain S-box protein [Bacteroidia bacterium]|nr:PAS domain S-box protein [Bacteroidia bacterium]
MRQVILVERGTDIKYDESREKFFNISMDKGIVGKCATELKTFLVNDTSIHPDYVADKLENKSEISVPIIYEQKLIGVLDSESSLPNSYNDKIRRTLEGIASLLAIKLNELSNLDVLEANNAKLTSLIKGNPAAIAMLDTGFNYIEVSERWVRDFTRNSSNNLIGRNHFDLNPRILMRWKNGIEKALRGNSKEIIKEAYRHFNGKTSYFTGKVSPWYTFNNQIGGVIIMAENVTNAVKNDLKLSQTSLELNEVRKFGQMFNWEFKLETGSITWYHNNDDIKNEEIVHKLDEIFEFIEPECHAEIKSGFQKAIEQRGRFYFIHPFQYQGEKFWLNNNGKVLIEDNRIIGIAGHAQNITAKVNAENANKIQNKKLVKINRELD